MLKEEQLWQAVTDGDVIQVKSLLGDPAGVDVNWVGEDRSDTALHRGCRFGRAEVVKTLLAHPHIDVNKGNMGQASPFNIACQEGHLETAKILLGDPRTEVNQQQREGASPFCKACQNGHAAVVSMLLGDPRIDINLAYHGDVSPFFMACQNGRVDVVALMVDDPRVNLNLPNRNRSSPLWMATQNGHLRTVQLILACGRDIETKMKSSFNDKTAAEVGRLVATLSKGVFEDDDDYLRCKTFGPVIADIVDSYELNPTQVRAQLRRLPGVRGWGNFSSVWRGIFWALTPFHPADNYIGNTFAQVIFVADKFATPTNPHGGIREALTLRFFKIATSLPLDLQMVLCNRMFGSHKDVIPSKIAEPAFRWLARSAWSTGE